ncbi:MAG TPA: sulfatase [Phycisphaerae bacterium]|nr:sulfatase [Phycisphaerae bacterium]
MRFDRRHRSRPAVLGIMILAVLAGCKDEVGADRTPKPVPLGPPLANRVDTQNVILISVDTLRADHLACYGHEFVRSPAIDGLAAEGMLFTQHVGAAPTTLPSHTSLMTGTYPHTHGIPKQAYVVHPDNVMLAEMLKDAGFVTGAFIGAFPLDASFGFDQGFEHFDARFDLEKEDTVRDQAQRRAEAITDSVIDWLDSRQPAPDERLFLFIHYFDVHWPYDAPPPHRGMYRRDSLSVGTTMEDIRRVQDLLREPATHDEGLKYARALDAEYCAEITYCDYHIDRLFRALRNRRLYDNSLIVLTSDHGETQHEHENVFNHGWSVYDTEIHIPLILRFPGGRFGGRREDRLCSNVDVAPTILHLLNLPGHDGLEGESFAGLIDAPLPPRDPVFAEATQPWTLPQFNDPDWRNQTKYQCARTDRYKYVARLGDGRSEFYDLQRDPAEQVNLLVSAQPYDRAVFERMSRLLDEWRAGARPFPSRELQEDDTREKLKRLGYVEDNDNQGPRQ